MTKAEQNRLYVAERTAADLRARVRELESTVERIVRLAVPCVRVMVRDADKLALQRALKEMHTQEGGTE